MAEGVEYTSSPRIVCWETLGSAAVFCGNMPSSPLDNNGAVPLDSFDKLPTEVTERRDGVDGVVMDASVANAVEVRPLASAANDRRLLREEFEKLSDGEEEWPRRESELEEPDGVAYGLCGRRVDV